MSETYLLDKAFEQGYDKAIQDIRSRTEYNCHVEIVIPPKDFLTMNIQTGSETEYKNYPIGIDSCIADEIKDLWGKGIRTCGCCCGHGYNLGYIEVVDEDIEKMEQLGYCHYIYPKMFGGADRKDAFIPKTGQTHNYDGYIEKGVRSAYYD